MNEHKDICKEEIFSVFYNSHVKSLRNYLIYKYKNEEQAEDILQETFIKLWQNCNKVSFNNAKSYIYTLATNSSLNVISHNKVVLEYAKKNINEDRTNESPEHILEQEEFKAKLVRAIDSINETQRIAFLMHRIDGKKYAEIAEELGISIKAVEKRIHLALVAIKKEIKSFR